jgi:hypothetical protein
MIDKCCMKYQVKTSRNNTRFVLHEMGRPNSIMNLGLLKLGLRVFTKIKIRSYTASIPFTVIDIK